MFKFFDVITYLKSCISIVFQGSFDEPSHYEDPPKVDTPATTSHPPLSKIVGIIYIVYKISEYSIAHEF